MLVDWRAFTLAVFRNAYRSYNSQYFLLNKVLLDSERPIEHAPKILDPYQ